MFRFLNKLLELGHATPAVDVGVNTEVVKTCVELPVSAGMPVPNLSEKRICAE